jgi:RpiR family transcriptional regulator, carbohydrate utilization regulator
MSAVGKIKKAYAELRTSQQNIADYFLETDVNGAGSSIDEIAEKVGTSVASISRFCKKIGFDSFGQFKIDLSRDKTYEPDRVLPIFKPTDDEDVCIHKAFSEAVTNLQDTELSVDFSVMKKVVDAIVKSGIIYFFGLGGSGGIGKLGELLFSHLGYRTKAISDPYEMAIAGGHTRKGDLAFGLSHTGRNKVVIESVRTAAARGAVTAALTNYRDSALAESAEYVLETACYEGRIHFAQSNSMVAQITIVNALYLLTASRSSEEVIREVDIIEESCQRSLRVKNNK